MVKKVGVIGLLAGDEGKANVVSRIAQLAIEDVLNILSVQQRLYAAEEMPIMVERFQGGGNAGHTFSWGGQEFKTHQVPMGTAVPGTYNLNGQGMFVDVRKLVNEMSELKELGLIITPNNFGIASNAHVTLDYHVHDDKASFEIEDHTSTGSGIKQTAVDKVGRVGMRFVEFLDQDLMKEILLDKRFPGNTFPDFLGSVDKFVASYDAVREKLAPFVTLEHVARRNHGKHVWIGEGAQGAILDLDTGLYPGITSSNPTLVPNRPDIILGVFKSYISNVGTGDRPFVTRIEEQIEGILRDLWEEFGTTTGRPRELGWLNLVELKYTTEKCQVDYLAATCGDRLQALYNMEQKILMATGVKINGKVYTEWDTSFDRRDTLSKAEPIYEEFKPWETLFDEDGKLTSNAERFYGRIQEVTGKEIIFYGNGPKPEDVKEIKNPLIFI